MSTIKYSKPNIDKEEYDYHIKCKYHKICNGFLPDRWYEIRGRFFCIPCEKIFGKLKQ